MTVCAKILLTVTGAEKPSGAVDNDRQSTIFTVCMDKPGWHPQPLGERRHRLYREREALCR